MVNHSMPRSRGWLPAIAPRRLASRRTPEEAQRPLLTGGASRATLKQHAPRGAAVQRARVVVALLIASSLTLPGCWWDPPKPPDRNPDGTYNVSDHEVTTQEAFSAGSAVHVQARGSVNFGGAVGPFGGLGAPTLTADGDSWPTPVDYPAPALRKNSLICKVGSIWYQCGQDATFVPSESGNVTLRPNDRQLEDNSQDWRVTVTPAPAGTQLAYGPFAVSNAELTTGIVVGAGSTVRVMASGLVDFGGGLVVGAPVLGPDGDSWSTPADYPAPALRKNSLICKVSSRWYQCGQDATFVPSEPGTLILRPNDAHLEDNSLGWSVRVLVSPAGTSAPGPASYGPFAVSNSVVATGVSVAHGSTVQVRASGLVDFGGALAGIGAPVLGPDGDDAPTPITYPAPELRKNSLICKVGSIWYQCGRDTTFHPAQDGDLLLQANDGQLADNSRGWSVSVLVTTPAPNTPDPRPSPSPTHPPQPQSYGPFAVSRNEINSGIEVREGWTVHVEAAGLINFGGGVPLFGGAPILGPDGDDWATPADYPAPELRKNSLICKVGSRWYQCGRDVTFAPEGSGVLTLRPNDKDLADNSLGWQVTVAVTPR
jgi:hypothetical protein